MNERKLALGQSYDKILFLETQYISADEASSGFFLEELFIEHRKVFESYNKKISDFYFKANKQDKYAADDGTRRNVMDFNDFVLPNYQDVLKLMKKNNCSSVEELISMNLNKSKAILDIFQLNIKNILYIKKKFID